MVISGGWLVALCDEYDRVETGGGVGMGRVIGSPLHPFANALHILTR